MKVSIIIPIYNQEKYLEDCLKSVLNQDIEDYQVLLVDDGSTDNSKNICKKYCRQSPVFQYIYQDNSGLGEARNTGLKFAEGKYVLFLDSDDALETDCLGTLYAYMDKNETDILYVDEYVCDEKMNIGCINPTFPYMQTCIGKTDALEYCLQPAHIWARMYKRELFENIKFVNIWYEDMASFPELVHAAQKISYYKMPIVYYRQHKEAITHQEMDVRNLDVMKAWDKALHILNLTEKEKEAVVKSIKKSVITFSFFRMGYAKEYLAWYENVLLKEIIQKQSLPHNFEERLFQPDYPFIQQAKMIKDEKLIQNLEILEKLYIEGGVAYFTDKNKGEDNLMTEHVSLLYEGCLKLYCIRINAKSQVLHYAFQMLREQNLISLKGMIKKLVLEKIIVSAFMEYGCLVRIVES